MFSYVFALVVCYLILLWFVPKKTNLYEILRIPIFLVRSIFAERKNMITEKHKFGKHRRQYVLFFKPLNNHSPKKNVIVYYHGGGWRSGSPELLKSNAQFLINQGYFVFMPSYRRAPFNGYQEIREDLTNSLQKVIEIMEDNHLVDKKIILGGMSAGGNLAALKLYDRKELAKIGFAQERFGGIMFFGAPLDLSTMKDTFVLRDFAGKRTSKTFEKANPINHLQADEKIPVLCVHGTHDGLVPFSSALSFTEKLKSINENILTFIPLNNTSHLKTASWAYADNDIRKIIIDWLKEREN